jgi:hypothetical protein
VVPRAPRSTRNSTAPGAHTRPRPIRMTTDRPSGSTMPSTSAVDAVIRNRGRHRPRGYQRDPEPSLHPGLPDLVHHRPHRGRHRDLRDRGPRTRAEERTHVSAAGPFDGPRSAADFLTGTGRGWTTGQGRFGRLGWRVQVEPGDAHLKAFLQDAPRATPGASGYRSRVRTCRPVSPGAGLVLPRTTWGVH